ncbi:MAG: helix-turn-helix transcriptional regulator [Pseudomonadota bacterium]
MAFYAQSAKTTQMIGETANDLVATAQERLRNVRLMHGFKSRRAFAEHCGLNEANYYKEEAGKIAVQPATLITVSRVFKISADYLLLGDEGSLTVNQQKSLRDLLSGDGVKDDDHVTSPVSRIAGS